MAKLNGVTTEGNGVIVYEGRRYEKAATPARLGDILRTDDEDYVGIEADSYYLADIKRGGHIGFTDDDGDERSTTDDCHEFGHAINPEDFEFYREVVIDGRKAEITAPGRRFPSYAAFANKYGYPDAINARKAPEKGDVVTLLTSGPHLNGYYGDTLWIVEASNGERHIINEKGLRILDVKRESSVREVKRKANVGERIKIVSAWSTSGKYIDGDEFVVDSISDVGPGVNVDAVKTSGIGEDNPNGYISDSEYVVLEPVATISLANPPSHLEDTVVRLTRRVADLDARLTKAETQIRVAREDIVLIEDGVTDDIDRLTARVAELEREKGAKYVEVASSPVVDRLPSSINRDYVIERAKADVAELLRTHRKVYGKYVGFWPEVIGESAIWTPMQRVEFAVNRDKRTVVALIKYLPPYCGDDETDIFARGVAKCAPDDVFNSHIGRAIALRRALGLEVPTEYTKCPQPTEPRVGDVVDMIPWVQRIRTVNIEGGPDYVMIGFAREGFAEGNARIIDDSRDGVDEKLPNPKRTDLVTAARSGYGGYIVKGETYWVAEVDGCRYRLIPLGYGIEGGVWCERSEFVFGTEVSAA